MAGAGAGQCERAEQQQEGQRCPQSGVMRASHAEDSPYFAAAALGGQALTEDKRVCSLHTTPSQPLNSNSIAGAESVGGDGAVLTEDDVVLAGVLELAVDRILRVDKGSERSVKGGEQTVFEGAAARHGTKAAKGQRKAANGLPFNELLRFARDSKSALAPAQREHGRTIAPACTKHSTAGVSIWRGEPDRPRPRSPHPLISPSSHPRTKHSTAGVSIWGGEPREEKSEDERRGRGHLHGDGRVLVHQRED